MALICPHCGGNNCEPQRADDTGNVVFRVYQCPDCKEKFRTLELKESWFQELQIAMAHVARVMSLRELVANIGRGPERPGLLKEERLTMLVKRTDSWLRWKGDYVGLFYDVIDQRQIRYIVKSEKEEIEKLRARFDLPFDILESLEMLGDEELFILVPWGNMAPMDAVSQGGEVIRSSKEELDQYRWIRFEIEWVTSTRAADIQSQPNPRVMLTLEAASDEVGLDMSTIRRWVLEDLKRGNPVPFRAYSPEATDREMVAHRTTFLRWFYSREAVYGNQL